jgi:microcystin-dependent protein
MTLDAVANPDADGVVGSIVMYAGEILPSAKWRWAHGAQEISRTEFSLYYSRVGDRWGNGDGSTTVDLPNFDKKFPVGMDSSGADADYETGDTGGAASGALPANTSGAAVAGFTSTGSQAVSGVSGPENSHTHPLTGSVPTIPPYNAVRFIVKVA